MNIRKMKFILLTLPALASSAVKEEEGWAHLCFGGEKERSVTGRLPNGAGLGHLEEEGRGWIQTSEDLDFIRIFHDFHVLPSRQVVAWHRPYCVDLEESTFSHLRSFLERYCDKINSEIPPLPFPSSRYVIYMCICVCAHMCTHIC